MKYNRRLFAQTISQTYMQRYGADRGKQEGEGNEHLHRSGARENIAKASRTNGPSVLKTFSAVLSS